MGPIGDRRGGRFVARPRNTYTLHDAWYLTPLVFGSESMAIRQAISNE
jgi:hypothetical protein